MKNTIKKRNPIAYDLMTNGLYKPKVIKNKKKYDRKKLKNGKELLKNLSHYFLSHKCCPIKYHINSITPTFSICLPC